MNLTRDIIITRYDKGKVKETSDIIVREYPLTIIFNGEELVTLLCSPKSLHYLALGFLLSEGIIKEKSEIESINIEEKQECSLIYIRTCGDRKLSLYEKSKYSLMKTSSGAATMDNNFGQELFIKNHVTIHYKNIIDLMDSFISRSEIFQNTGGVHSAALADGDSILLFHEDVGRHNALDKVIGEAFDKGINYKDKFILTSGRISSEMLSKAAKRGISVFISRSAPMDLALKLGGKINMTIIGFVRGQRMNIYTGKERVTF